MSFNLQDWLAFALKCYTDGIRPEQIRLEYDFKNKDWVAIEVPPGSIAPLGPSDSDNLPVGTRLWFHQKEPPQGWKVVDRLPDSLFCEKVTGSQACNNCGNVGHNMYVLSDGFKVCKGGCSDDGSPMAAVMIATDKPCDTCKRKMHKSPIKLDKWYCAFCRKYTG